MGKKGNQGIKSRNVHEVGVRTGRGAVKINKAAVNQLGNHTGSHVTQTGKDTGYRGEDLVRGPGYNPAPGYGNAVALNVGGGGPGKGYEVIGKSGQQGQHGNVNPGNPTPNAKELWPGWEK
jgi:hypothetical protein